MKFFILTILLLSLISCDKNSINSNSEESINLGATPESSAIVTKLSTDLADATYNAGDAIEIKVHFSKVVDIVGSPTIELVFDSEVRKATYIAGTGSSIVSFSYMITDDLTASPLLVGEFALNGGTVKDSLGDIDSIQLPSAGDVNSLSASHYLKVGKSDDFNQPRISNQWTKLDRDNYDMNGNGDVSDDGPMLFFQQEGALTMNGRGGDIWRNKHEFIGMYLNDQTGDFDYSVKVFQRNEVNVWGKSGILITSEINDFYMGGTFQCVTTPQRKVSVQHEGAIGDISQHRADSSSSSALPVWIRVTKADNTLTCFYKYSEGGAWIEHEKGPQVMSNLTGTFDIGLISTSHNSGSNSVVQFDDFVDLGIFIK